MEYTATYMDAAPTKLADLDVDDMMMVDEDK